MQRARFWLLAGAVTVAAILIAVRLSSNSVNVSTTPVTAPNPFAGVPQHGDTLGVATAPATLVVFEDPQCPFCRQWALDTLPQVVDDFVRGGRVKLVYRGVEVIGPNSEIGLRAIYAAGRQNKLWNLADALYRRQGAENSNWITPSVISAAATAVGADAKAILAAAPTPQVSADLLQALHEATAAGVGGTPTFQFRRRLGVPQFLQLSALDTATFESLLEQALQ